MACPHCDQNPPGSHFCNRCGSGLATTRPLVAARAKDGERRHLTILFADLVGSVALSQRLDPEELGDLISRYQAVCERAIGRFEGHLAERLGDGVVAYFGFPRAHEDDTERAVRAALEIQDRLDAALGPAAPRARIGIHHGLVVMSPLGDPVRGESRAVGSAVNVAARLQSLAEDGGIAISAVARSLAQNAVARDLGVRRLSGLEPIRVFAVDGVTGGRAPAPEAKTEAIFGREEELGRLRWHLREAQAGRGRAVLVTGEPGVGKSRLVEALRESQLSGADEWVHLSCSEFARDSAFSPVIALLESWVGIGVNGAAAERADRLRAVLATTPGLEVGGVLRPLLALLGLPAPGDLPDDGPAAAPLPPEELRDRTMAAFAALLVACAEARPVVLAIEDLQWADPSTRALFERFVALAPGRRILLLATARPESPRWQGEHVEEVALGRLDATAVYELISSVVAEASLPPAALERIADRADGVPLFVVHLTLDWKERSLRLTEEADAIPGTLVGLLTARLDGLGPAKRVAQLGAVLGREFRRDLLLRVTELPEPIVDDALERLARANLVALHGGVVRFHHALVQDTAYQSLLLSDRRMLHGRVAEALLADGAASRESAPEVLGRHFEEGQQWGRAADHYLAAGRRATERFANAEAVALLQRALALTQRMPAGEARDRVELAASLALAPPLIVERSLSHPEVKRLHERIAALAEAGRTLGDRLPPWLYLSRYYLRTGEVAQSARVGESLLALGAETGVTVAELIGHQIVGTCDLLRAPSPSAIAHLGHAVELAEKIQLPAPTAGREPDPLAMLRAIYSHALARGGRSEEALEEVRAARARADAIGHLPTRVLVTAFATVTFSTLEDFALTRDWAADALALARAHRFPISEAQALTLGGWARVALGDPAGLEDAEAGLALTRKIGLRGGMCHYILGTVEANRLAGRLARAHELISLGESLYAETGEAVAVGRLQRARAHVLIAEGRAAEAVEPLRRAIARFELLMEPRERACTERELAALTAALRAA